MTKIIESFDENNNNRGRVTYAALTGVALAATIQLLGIQDLDKPLKFSLYVFACTIPMLVTSLGIRIVEEKCNLVINSTSIRFVDNMGMFGSVIGIGGLFLHFSYVIGLSFLISSLLGVGIYIKNFIVLDRATDDQL